MVYDYALGNAEVVIFFDIGMVIYSDTVNTRKDDPQMNRFSMDKISQVCLSQGYFVKRICGFKAVFRGQKTFVH